MINGGNNLRVVGDLSGVGACVIQSHNECRPEECEVREQLDANRRITDEQIKVSVATAISGLISSSLFGLGVLAVWMYCAVTGHSMPDIPWVVSSIAAAPFTAGVLTTWKIPRLAKLRLTIEPHEEDES